MILRRLRAAAASLFVALVVVTGAMASLVGLLVFFSYVLELRLTLALGAASLQFIPGPQAGPEVFIFGGAILASLLFFIACGLVSAGWSYHVWRPGR